MWPPKTPNEHVDRVPKNDTVNMRTGRGPGDPPGGRGGRHLSCLRGAQLQGPNIKEISIMLGLTIHTTADDISKRLSFLTLGLIVTDAHFNKGGSGIVLAYVELQDTKWKNT